MQRDFECYDYLLDYIYSQGVRMELLKTEKNDFIGVELGIFKVKDYYEVLWRPFGISDWNTFENSHHCRAEYDTYEQCEMFIKRGMRWQNEHPDNPDKVWKELLSNERIK